MSTTSLFQECPTCGEWDFVGAHKCPPRWQVRNVDDDLDEVQTIFAYTPEEAVKQFADIWDEESLIACQGHQITVIITSDRTKTQQFIVTGEMVPRYNISQPMIIDIIEECDAPQA